MTSLHADYSDSRLDRFDSLGPGPLTPPTTYPGGWVVIALLAAVVALWMPAMILAVIGAVVLAGLNIWKAVRRG